MGKVFLAAAFHREMSANQIRQTRTVLQAIVLGHGSAWSKFSPSEEIADRLKQAAVLEGYVQQAGNHVVEADQFRGAVRAFEPKEDFGGVFFVMDADMSVRRAATLAFCVT